MTQMESPKRKMQKKNDYQRHKLFRKIKRRRKAQAEAEQQIAEKQLRKKLKLPKFDRGEDELSTYKKQVEMFNDANSDPTLPGRLVDRNRVTVNPETGDVMEVGGHINLDPVIITGKMPDNLKQTINKNIESDRIQDLLYKDRLSPVDPIGELVVESAAIGKPLELAGKAALYGIGRYGGKLGLNKLQGLARQKLLEKEFALSNADKQLVKDIAYSKPGYDNELIISPSKKQKRLQLSQPTYQVYTGDKHKISEVIDDSGNVNLANLFKIQNEALSNIPGGRIARHRLENPDWHKTDWNTFLHSRDAYQRALQAGYPSVKDSKDWEEYRATMNQVRHKLLDTEHLINGKYPSGKELEKAIDNRQMDLIMANFDVANGYGSDYYNAYKDLLDKAKQTNSYRDWQNIIDFENHIRNSLKYLPAVTPFAIGAKSNDYNSGKDIHIKPSKRGTFTKAAKQRGMSVQGFANRVLRNPSKYSAAMRKKANFARNASKWNK